MPVGPTVPSGRGGQRREAGLSRPSATAQAIHNRACYDCAMRRLSVVAALLFLLGASLAQEDNAVEVRVEIYVVSEVQGTEQFTQATTARPGQVVEYRLFAVNRSETTLPAGTVKVTGPVPEGTTFVPNSETPA